MPSTTRPSRLPGILLLPSLLLYGLVPTSALEAQQEVIRGHLIDDANLRPVPDASVSLVSEDERRLRTVPTDSAGFFLLAAPDAGTYRLEARRVGYATTLSQPVRLMDADTLTVEFRMLPEAVLIDPITVTARTGRGRHQFQRRQEEWGQGIFLDPAAVDSIDPRHPAEVFRDQEGMWLSWDWGVGASGARGPYPRIRSHMGRGCMLYVIDGTPAWQPRTDHPDAGVPAWLRYPLAQLRPEDLTAVEIYRSAAEAPPEIRHHGMPRDVERIGTCGVAVFWTRRGW